MISAKHINKAFKSPLLVLALWLVFAMADADAEAIQPDDMTMPEVIPIQTDCE